MCHALIRELVERVDRPQPAAARIESAQELEWVMQVVNHALALPFNSPANVETLSAAVRIYLAWSTSLTREPHACCPAPLREHPDLYFR